METLADALYRTPKWLKSSKAKFAEYSFHALE
jgi:hypothetical protein